MITVLTKYDLTKFEDINDVQTVLDFNISLDTINRSQIIVYLEDDCIKIFKNRYPNDDVIYEIFNQINISEIKMN